MSSPGKTIAVNLKKTIVCYDTNSSRRIYEASVAVRRLEDSEFKEVLLTYQLFSALAKPDILLDL